MLKTIGKIRHHIITRLRLSWSAIERRFIYLFPTSKFEHEIQALAKARREVKELYDFLEKGKDSAQLLQIFQDKASDPTSDDYGMANLLLSQLYQEEIRTPYFNLDKDDRLVKSHFKTAVKVLGNNPKLSVKAAKFIDYIRTGGQAFYAFNRLTTLAKLDDGDKGSWASKVLSFIYSRGMSNKNFLVLPDFDLAKKFRQQAEIGLRKFSEKVVFFTTRLTKALFKSDKSLDLLKDLASTENKCAQYQYARTLEKKGIKSPRIPMCYKASANATKESALSFAEEGFSPAIAHLVHAHELNSYGLTNYNQESSHYRFQLILQGKHKQSKPLLDSLMTAANVKKDSAACLKMAWYYFEQQNAEGIAEAENYLSNAESNKEKWQDYDYKLYEKLCIALGDLYSLKNVEKAISFFQKIPSTSKRYATIQYQIAHLQRFVQNKEETAVVSFTNSGEQGSSQAVSSALKHYWHQNFDKLTTEQKEIVRHHVEMKKPMFWDKVSPRLSSESTCEPDCVTLLKSIISKLQAINDTRINNSQTGLNLTELKQQLEKNQKFSKSDNLLLNEVYQLLLRTESQEKESAYNKIGADVCIDFVITMCCKILSRREEDLVNEKNINTLPTYAGGVK